MKNINLFLLFFICNFISAQEVQGIIGSANWFEGWTNFKPKSTEYNQQTKILSGNISINTTLYKKYVYMLAGTVRIVDKAILTIEPGTVIRGDSETLGALIITKGSKINAIGTDSDPIVFTSNKLPSDRKAGDWGGLIILGDAPINTPGSMACFQFDINPKYNMYGGKNDNDSSGTLKFVRVEFGGKKDITGYSSNGISLAGVGGKTVLENIIVSNSLDDSFQIYGGNLLLNNIISVLAKDDDFDLTSGTQCTINNSIAIRYPYTSDVLRSRCFEIETFEKRDDFDGTKKKTLVKLNNVTMVNNEDNNMGLVKEAVFLNEEAELEINKCVVTGFSSFVSLNNYFFHDDNFKKIKIVNSKIDNCPSLFSEETSKINFEINQMLSVIKDWYMVPKNKITQTEIGVKNLFINNDIKKNPDFRLK